jgi:CRISPR-associated protein Csh2
MMAENILNSEILLIYEAKCCNPNGDPDAENRPRIDFKTNINFVSDVRLKRFFRDYIVEKFGEDFIYVTKVAGESVRADTRLEKILDGRIDKDKVNEVVSEVLKRCIDARLFGATIPIGKGEAEKGAAKSYIGPVQFTWGFSFHKVELMESSAITSVFSGRQIAERYGTMGRDWRLHYSLIGFYGVVSGRRAKGTGMDKNDLRVFDNLLWTALQVQPTTRSKIGEMPHLYLRVEYNDADTVLGDLRKFVKVKHNDAVRDFKDLEVNFDELTNHLRKNLDRVSKIYVRTSEDLSFVKGLIEKTSQDRVFHLPHRLSASEVEAIIKRT